MYTNGHPHDQMLRPLYYTAVEAEKIGSFQGFETETRRRVRNQTSIAGKETH